MCGQDARLHPGPPRRASKSRCPRRDVFGLSGPIGRDAGRVEPVSKGCSLFGQFRLAVSAKGLIRRVTTKTPHLVTAGAIGSAVAVVAGVTLARTGGHPSRGPPVRMVQARWPRVRPMHQLPPHGETSRLGRPHPSTDPGPAISRPISAVTPVSQPTKSATTVTQPTPTPPSAAANSPSDPGPAATVTTTTLPEPGTLLSGDASTNDARGWANAQWSGTAHYAPGPHAGTESFCSTVPTGLPFQPGRVGGSDFTGVSPPFQYHRDRVRRTRWI